MVEPTEIIQRVFENKKEILRSTHRIIELTVVGPKFIEKEGDIKQIKKEINTILSCLSELKYYAPFFEKDRFPEIIKVGFNIIALLDSGFAFPILLNAFCCAVNSVEIKPTRRSVKVVVGADLGRLKTLISKEERNF